jgi:PAS domain S-box-containing protein
MGALRWNIAAILEKRDAWVAILAATTVFAFVLNYYGLVRGLSAITPHLFYIPIVIATYWFPRRGVIVTVALAMGYLSMGYVMCYPDVDILTQITARFYVMVAIGVIVASLSGNLKEQEDRYHGIFDYSEAGIFLMMDLRTGFVIEEANQKGAEILGYKTRDLAGMGFQQLCPDEGEMAALRKKLDSRCPVTDYQCHLRRADGSPISVLLAAGPLPDRRMVFTIADITERELAAEALKASKDQYMTTIDAMSDGMYLVDRDLRIVLINSTFRRWLEHAGVEGNILGRGPDQVIPCKSRELCNDLKRVFATGENLVGIDEFLVAERLFMTETRKIPVIEDSRVVRVVVIMRNITRQQQIEEEKRLAYEQIEKNIEQFAILGDHIRNPMQVIVGLADLEGGAIADRIQFQAREIDRTITQLDRGWIESEKIREFIRKYYGIGKR